MRIQNKCQIKKSLFFLSLIETENVKQKLLSGAMKSPVLQPRGCLRYKSYNKECSCKVLNY